MEKIKNFFTQTIPNYLKGKSAGFYIVVADIVLALILGIVFFSTYQGAMGNNAAGNLPEVIGVCILLGAVLDVLTLVFAEYPFVHLLAIAAYSVSLMKEIYLIPNLIVDQINGIAYQGGNFPLNLFYLIMQFLILISAIVATFLGLFTKKGQEESDEKIKQEGRFCKKNVIKLTSGGLVGVIAIVAAVSTCVGIDSASQGQTPGQGAVVLDDIQKEWQDKTIEYDFDPTSVIYQEDTHPYREATPEQIINNVSNSPNRFLHYKVYEFEGKYTEAYQGNFNYSYSYIYLWEDGLYNGSAAGTDIYGYWYNKTKEGNDCLVLKDTAGNDMVCEKSNDQYYDWFGDLKSNVNGGRTFKMNGFLYYPVIGIYVNTGSDDLVYDFRQEFKKSDWTVNLIRNNLKHSALINPDEPTWVLPDTTIPGAQTVEISWLNESESEEAFTTSVDITVGEDEAEYEFNYSDPSVKKEYRYVDLFDPTGIYVTRVTDDGRREDIDPASLDHSFDYENGNIVFSMTNGKDYTIPVSFDTSRESNTIHATFDNTEADIVITSATTAEITADGETATFNIALTGTSGLATVEVGDKISGSDTLYALLSEEFSIMENEEGLFLTMETFMRSATKANSYNQLTDTFFVFGHGDSNTVTLVWEFDYNGLLQQYMECSYTLNGSTLTINELTGVDSNNQWQWSTKSFYNLTPCTVGDLPFYPY